jgi:hypothetical protein
MGLNHYLDIVRNQIPGRQDVMHPGVSLGRAVTRPDHAEFSHGAACPVDALSYIFRDLPEVGMTRDQFIPRICDAHDRSFKIVLGKPHGLEYASVETPVGFTQDIAASITHKITLPFISLPSGWIILSAAVHMFQHTFLNGS